MAISKEQIRGILQSDENAGYIIRRCAELEWNIDLIITRFFTADKRFDEFMEIIVPKFSFAEKYRYANAQVIKNIEAGKRSSKD